MAGFEFDDRQSYRAQGDLEANLTAAACLDRAANLLADFEKAVGARRIVAPGADHVSGHAEKAIQAAVQNQLVAAMNGRRRFRSLSAGLLRFAIPRE